jgi:hypothetical protein
MSEDSPLSLNIFLAKAWALPKFLDDYPERIAANVEIGHVWSFPRELSQGAVCLRNAYLYLVRLIQNILLR